MSGRAISFTAFAAAPGSRLIAGVFFAFPGFVMAALARPPASQGAAAMQAINITVVNPLFMGVFIDAAARHNYLAGWTMWNHARGAAPPAASAAFIAALRAPA